MTITLGNSCKNPPAAGACIFSKIKNTSVIREDKEEELQYVVKLDEAAASISLLLNSNKNNITYTITYDSPSSIPGFSVGAVLEDGTCKPCPEIQLQPGKHTLLLCGEWAAANGKEKITFYITPTTNDPQHKKATAITVNLDKIIAKQVRSEISEQWKKVNIVQEALKSLSQGFANAHTAEAFNKLAAGLPQGEFTSLPPASDWSVYEKKVVDDLSARMPVLNKQLEDLVQAIKVEGQHIKEAIQAIYTLQEISEKVVTNGVAKEVMDGLTVFRQTNESLLANKYPGVSNYYKGLLITVQGMFWGLNAQIEVASIPWASLIPNYVSSESRFLCDVLKHPNFPNEMKVPIAAFEQAYARHLRAKKLRLVEVNKRAHPFIMAYNEQINKINFRYNKWCQAPVGQKLAAEKALEDIIKASGLLQPEELLNSIKGIENDPTVSSSKKAHLVGKAIEDVLYNDLRKKNKDYAALELLKNQVRQEHDKICMELKGGFCMAVSSTLGKIDKVRKIEDIPAATLDEAFRKILNSLQTNEKKEQEKSNDAAEDDIKEDEDS